MTMRNERPSALMGRSVPRLEDGKLLRGAGRFVDDIDLPDMLHATFVRSPVAHGLLQRVDPHKARAMPGIRAVLTYADLRPVLACDRIPLALPVSALRFHVDPCVLARQEVHYVGEPVALVVADSRQQAEDAAALVELDVRPLPAVLEPRAGLEPGAPKARLDCPDNLVAHWVVEYGDVERAFACAVHRMSEHFRIHKGGGHSIEARGVLARFDATDELLTVWDSTQMPHKTKRVLVEALGLSEERVRVIAPDVGGGFGPKNPFYPEELAVPAAALLLGRPIKWVEDRREGFTATNHEREQDWELEAAVDRDGRLLAIRGHLRHDHGATTPSGLSLPQNSATNLIGPYVLPAYRLEVSLCLTNLVAATSTRGAGRTQGTFVMERMLDRIADELGLGRDEVRRRNLITPQQMPYVTPGHDPRRLADDLRQRRLSRVSAPRAGGGRVVGFPGTPRNRTQRRALARHRPRQLRRRHRARPVRKRRRPHRTIRKDIRHDRGGRTGTGHPHHAGAARRRRARRRPAADPRHRR